MLADKYHVVAPDFPGYGESSAPSVNDFEYSFERLATVTEKFTEKLNLSSYALYLSDIGAAGEQARKKGHSRLFELALVLVRFDHVASVVVNANHSIV
jgi:pimeloyl-ACP methyl ester carboxylesterase